MKLVGGLIGKGGEAIKSLQQEGCASISVGKPKLGDELQKLSIKAGSEREADECERWVWRRVDDLRAAAATPQHCSRAEEECAFSTDPSARRRL